MLFEQIQPIWRDFQLLGDKGDIDSEFEVSGEKNL